VFVGFARSFYLKAAFSEWPAPPEPIFLMHGLAFTAWVLLLPAQAMLVARGRVDLHRLTGAFGVALAIGMVVLGILGALVAARRPEGFVGIPVPPLQFLAVPLFAIALFALFVVLAVARRRDTQSHKRLMLLASFQLVTPAVARWPVIAGFGPPALTLLAPCGMVGGHVTPGCASLHPGYRRPRSERGVARTKRSVLRGRRAAPGGSRAHSARIFAWRTMRPSFSVSDLR
jgi:hypothetical protein